MPGAEPRGRETKEDLMASIEWLKDVDQGLDRARILGKPVLLDFSAAPM